MASKISGPPNMQAIPAAINNFKGQVFKGVINNANGPLTLDIRRNSARGEQAARGQEAL